jgi:hypothetical protein
MFEIFFAPIGETARCETSKTVVSMTDYNGFNLANGKLRHLNSE